MLRPWFAILLPALLAACVHSHSATAQTSVPLGQDLGASGPINSRGGEGHEGYGGFAQPIRSVEMAHSGHNDVHGSGVVKAVDVAARKITLAHQPISQIGWPAMTMEFAVAPAVDLNTLKPDAPIDFSMEQGQGGMYVIQSISPRGGR
jgi:Cu/Ag efflux protein CusF